MPAAYAFTGQSLVGRDILLGKKHYRKEQENPVKLRGHSRVNFIGHILYILRALKQLMF